MDELAKGLSLLKVNDIFGNEFKAVLEGRRAERQIAYSHFLDAFCGGLTFPVPEGSARSEIQRVISAAVAGVMFNSLAAMSITHFMNNWMEGATETAVAHMRQGFSEMSRQEGERRQQNLATPQAIEEAEFAGTFQELSPVIQLVLQTIDPKLSHDLDNRLKSILESCPSFWCNYKVMTAIRLNRPGVKENDLWDFLHVVPAVPNVDCLACDSATRHLCTNVLKMDKKYGTRIVSQESELMQWLQSLS
jgi:hypothetical protein